MHKINRYLMIGRKRYKTGRWLAAHYNEQIQAMFAVWRLSRLTPAQVTERRERRAARESEWDVARIQEYGPVLSDAAQ